MRIYSILIIILLPIVSISQDKISLDDFIKGKDGKSPTSGKHFKNNKSSSYVDHISKIFDNHIFKITHYYGLKKGKDIYGQDGQDYFGYESNLAFAINEKLWMQSNVLRPWSNDDSYKDYGEEYQAVSVSVKLNWLNDPENEVVIKRNKYDIRSEMEGAIGYLDLDESIDSYFEISAEPNNVGALVLYTLEGEDIVKEVIFCSPVWESGIGKVNALAQQSYDAGIYLQFSGDNAVLSFSATGIVNDGVIVPIKESLIPASSTEEAAVENPTASKKKKGKLQKIK